MKILLVVNSLYTGGAEFSTLSLYQWMIAKGHQVKLLLLKNASPSFNPADFGISDFSTLEKTSFFKKVRAISETVSQFQPDVVHSVLFDANMVVRASRITAKGFLHMESLVNEVYSDFRLSDPKVSKLKLNLYRIIDGVTSRFGTDFFHANGVAVANHYIAKVGVDPRKIKVIPRGRKPNPFVKNETSRNELRQSLGLDERIVLVNVARHEFQKAQDTLLEAIAKLKGNLKFKLLLVGREGNFTGKINNLIEKLGLKEVVTILGHRDDVTRILAAADIFVFPSRFEGLPGALIEAEAAALPVVCSDIPNNLEVVDPARNAIVFPVNNSELLSNALRELINNKKRREEMSGESAMIYHERFDIDSVHQQMYDMIEKLVVRS
ncbi:glycosyltransferase family 4 protein [Chryseolinea sp. T2]|uniref:glycosyltransferase family 4 protein n=1 Tax=Chryseolinea sp. T2 TaxID=3129255 RepID=UPI003077B21C